MQRLELGPQAALSYTYTPPTLDSAVTFVFFNALTGDMALWESLLVPRLREQGHGFLAWNYRGQAGSPFAPGTRLDDRLIIADSLQLMDKVKPIRPVLVGLSIGGLFAARAWLEGAPASGLVLINTLRRPGPRLEWINDALLRAVEVGGMELLRDLYLPLLYDERWLAEHRRDFLKDRPYHPLPPDHGHYRLLADCRSADWNLPLEALSLPVLVVTGLMDRLFLDTHDLERLFERLPDGRRVEMSDAAHMLPAERPEALARALLAFVGNDR